MPSDPTLPDWKILIIEDEPALAMLLEEMVTSLGCRVAAIAATLQEAVDEASKVAADAAIVDLNLGGRKSTAAAEALSRRGIPMVFSTGYGAEGVAPEWSHCPILSKPYSTEQLAEALSRAVTRKSAG